MNFRRDLSVWRKALKLCKRHGVPLDVTSTRQRFVGRVSAHIGMGVDDMLHEAAHWLCSSTERRSLPNFGLGFANVDVEPQFMAVPQDEAEAEEYRVSVMGMTLMLQVGVKVEDVKTVMWEHNWRFAGIVEMDETIRQLVETDSTNLVTKHRDALLRMHRELVDEERRERAERRGA